MLEETPGLDAAAGLPPGSSGDALEGRGPREARVWLSRWCCSWAGPSAICTQRVMVGLVSSLFKLGSQKPEVRWTLFPEYCFCLWPGLGGASGVSGLVNSVLSDRLGTRAMATGSLLLLRVAQLFPAPDPTSHLLSIPHLVGVLCESNPRHRSSLWLSFWPWISQEGMS